MLNFVHTSSTPQNLVDSLWPHKEKLTTMYLWAVLINSIIFVVAAVTFYREWRGGNSYDFAWVPLIYLVTIVLVQIACYALVRWKNKLFESVLIYLISYVASFLFVVSSFENLGETLAIFNLIVLIANVINGFPQEWYIIGTTIGISNSVLIALIDLIAPFERYQLPFYYAQHQSTLILLISGLMAIHIVYHSISMFRRLSLKNKFFIAILNVAIIFILGASIFIKEIIKRENLNSYGTDLNIIASAGAENLSEYYAEEIKRVERFTNQPELITQFRFANEYGFEEEHEIMDLLERRDAQWDPSKYESVQVKALSNSLITHSLTELSLVLPPGTQALAVNRYGGVIGANYTPSMYLVQETYWDIALQEQKVASQVHNFSQESGVGVGVQLVIPILDPDQIETLGAVSITIPFREIAHQLQHEGLEDQEINLYFAHQDDVYTFLSSGSLRPIRNNFVSRTELTHALSSTEPYTFLNLFDTYQMVRTVDVPDFSNHNLNSATEMMVITTIETELILMQVHSINLILTLISMLVVGAIVTTVYLLTGLILKPITELTETASKIIDGDLNARLSIESQDEIGNMARLFNFMTHQLQNSLETLEERVTERTEKLEIAKNEAEAATRAKSDFLATMSHEIRTPMNGVIGMTSLLMDTNPTQEQQGFIDVIRKSGDSLLNIINDVLDFSKIESGHIELEHHPFQLRECIENALDIVAPRAFAKGLELNYQIMADLPEVVIGDITRVRQIMVNLLSNAIKFTHQGDVTVIVEQAHPIDEKHLFRFAVKDTGVGIPADRLDRLFKSFSQVDSSTTRKFGGTGLGLAISKRLAELMGGEMWVESTVNVGSTFYFTVQAEAVSHRDSRSIFDSNAALKGKSALIVDDNRASRRILSYYCSQWGLDTICVESAEDAIVYLKGATRPLNFLIVDHLMPDIDGLEFIDIVQRQTLFEGQIILMTTMNELGIKTQFERSGIDDILTKPIKPSLMYNILNIKSPHVTMPTQPGCRKEFDHELSQKHPLRILLVEDNSVNQKVAMRVLDRLGYRADMVANGLEAVEATRRQQYDLILMDIHMPEMDGIEATRQIKDFLPSDRHPYIVALTAGMMADDREKCIAAGMDAFLGKPFKVSDLTDIILSLKVPPLAEERSKIRVT